MRVCDGGGRDPGAAAQVTLSRVCFFLYVCMLLCQPLGSVSYTNRGPRWTSVVRMRQVCTLARWLLSVGLSSVRRGQRMSKRFIGCRKCVPPTLAAPAGAAPSTPGQALVLTPASTGVGTVQERVRLRAHACAYVRRHTNRLACIQHGRSALRLQPDSGQCCLYLCTSR